MGMAAQKIYDFAWTEFCDWYIELVKPRLYGEDGISKQAAQYTLSFVLKETLKLLHPFMPFITEEIYTHLTGENESIVISRWPEYDSTIDDRDAEEKLDAIIESIKAIRNVRVEMNVPPSKKAKVIIIARDNNVYDAMEDGKVFFEKLAGASSVEVMKEKINVPHDAVSAITHGTEIYMPLEDLIDKAKEIERLSKEKERLEKELERVNSKLSNERFISKAPGNVVEEEKGKKLKYQEMLDKVIERLQSLY
jgi:valyl-tRNA synthetase